MKRIFLLNLILFPVMAIMCFSNGSRDLPFYKIVQEMGYTDVETTPYETEYVSIPKDFGKVYLKYNEMLKKSGYDLSAYKGKRCVRYTYLIPSVNARANILVYNGKIIGGDICGITIDSIMIPIKRCDYET